MGRLDAAAAVTVPNSVRRVGFGALRWVGGGAIAAAVAVVALTVSHPIDNTSMPAVAAVEPSSSPQLAQPYLPLAKPLPNTTSPLFNNDAVQPVSFEKVLPGYYRLTNDIRLVPVLPGTYRVSLREQQPVPASAQVQQ